MFKAALKVLAVLLVAPVVVVQAQSRWAMINFVNEFGERTDQGAVSTEVESIRPMDFPYQGTTARIFVDCDRVWVRFSNAPNLTGGDIADGYSSYDVIARVDGQRRVWRARQSWGAEDISFYSPKQVVATLAGGSQVDMAFPWYGGSVAWSWSLTGSSDAIKRSCD